MTSQPEQPQQPPAQTPRRHLSPSERMGQSGGPLEPLERILDKGIVVDAWAEVRLLGIPLASVEARVIVASIETYLYYAQAIMEMPPIARGPMAGPRAMGRVAGEAFADEGLNPVLRQVGGQTAEPAQAMPQPQDQQQMLADLERRERELAERERALSEREENGEERRQTRRATRGASRDDEGG
jgi:gas vesicle structural protein